MSQVLRCKQCQVAAQHTQHCTLPTTWQSRIQALHHSGGSFEHEYKVVKLEDKFYLVKAAAPDAISGQQVIPDSDEESNSMHSSYTLGSKDAIQQHPPHAKRSGSMAVSKDSRCTPHCSTACCSATPGAQSDKGRKRQGQQHRLKTKTSGMLASDCSTTPVHAAKAAAAAAAAAGAGNGTQSYVRLDRKSVSMEGTAAQTKRESSPSAATLRYQPSSCKGQSPAMSGLCIKDLQAIDPSKPLASSHMSPQPQQSGQVQQEQQQQQSGTDTTVSSVVHELVCSAVVGLARHLCWSTATGTGLMIAYAQFVRMQQTLAMPAVSCKLDKVTVEEEGKGVNDPALACQAKSTVSHC